MSGQFDGDGPSRINPFAAKFGDQPWLRGNVPPWHMWGTLETLRIPITGNTAIVQTQQLSRVNYKRPETWHWLFFSRLVSGPTLAGAGNVVSVLIDFDCVFGLGRASVLLPAFESFRFSWTAPAGPPSPNEPKWSTTALRPERVPGDDPDHTIEQMVAEDIQCSCRVTVASDEFPVAPVVLEVAAFWAPKNHIRPDWLQLEVPIEAQFPGAELQGRIRGFLLQLPKPAKIRVSSGDGEPQELKPARSYARTAESIEALGVDLIECIDKDGAVLRALRLSEPEARRSDAAEVPKGIEVDPNALMLSHFANLLHRAYEHSTEIAFTRLVELAERLSSHTESIEARLAHTESLLRREQTDRIDDAFERAQEALAKGDGSDPLVQQMLGAFMSARMGQTPAQPKTNGKTNGKA